MRISDWSSDVCSSDLAFDGRDVAQTHDTAVRPSRNIYRSVTKILDPGQAIINQDQIELVEIGNPARARARVLRRKRGSDIGEAEAERAHPRRTDGDGKLRSAERRVGTCVSPCRARG